VSWLRLDDGFTAHPKVVQLSDSAFRSFLSGCCYAARYETDGLIPAKIVPTIATAKARRELVAAILWHESQAGVRIHDFLDWNRSRDEWEAERERKSRAGKLGAAAKKAKRQAGASTDAQAVATADVEADAKADVEAEGFGTRGSLSCPVLTRPEKEPQEGTSTGVPANAADQDENQHDMTVLVAGISRTAIQQSGDEDIPF
jgi:hypothetical protein